MTKQRTNPITYIKLKAHEIGYMTQVYGNPMSFGRHTLYYKAMREGIMCNKKMKCQYTRMSFSDHAYRLAEAEEDNLLQISDKATNPTSKEMCQLVPVCLPEETAERFGDDVCYCQFSKSGAESFRRLATEDFWYELVAWVKDAKKDARLNGKPFYRRDAIFAFMEEYHIDTEYFENIYRHYNREAKNM